MPAILYDRQDISDRGLSKVFDNGCALINGIGYTLVDQTGRCVRRYIHKSIIDPNVLFVAEGEPCDLIDDRYLEAYRLAGREVFLEVLRQNPLITPKKALSIAIRLDHNNKKFNV